MKPEIKKRWLKALRSGQYQQTQKRLTDGKGFCCLGVLCNLHALEKGKMWVQDNPYDISYLGATAVPPQRVVTWAGLEDFNPEIGDLQLTGSEGVPKTAASLAELNDIYHMSFDEIADLIEEKL